MKQPVWRPAGNLIAYVSDAAGNDDVWICDPSGASQINLTVAFKSDDAFPAWSPDGQRVAFFSERDGGGSYTMTALGSGVRRVVSGKPGIVYTFSLNWARDGFLVYTNFDASGRKQVYRATIAGPGPVCLTCGVAAGGAQAGDLSPSGRLLAFTSPETGPQARLSVLDLPTGQVRVVANQTAGPHWSADGTRLSFVSSMEGTPDLWDIPVDPRTGVRAGDPRRITSASVP